MSRLGVLVIICFVCALGAFPRVSAEDYVVLDLSADGAFQSYIEHNEFVFVKFFSPSCGHCKRLAPDYAAAAVALEESHPEIKLVEVDCSQANELCGSYDVRGYPTMKLFKKGSVVEYQGGRSVEAMTSWLIKKVGDPYTVVSTVEEAAKVLENKVVVVGKFVDMDEAHIFKTLADVVDDVTFVIATEKKFSEDFEFEKEPQVVMFKRFDDPIVEYDGNFLPEGLLEWVNSAKEPYVIEFLPETAQSILSVGPEGTVYFYFVKGDPDLSAYNEVAKKHRDSTQRFSYVDVALASNSRIADFFGSADSEEFVPRLFAFSLKKNLKFPFRGELTAEAFETWMSEMKEGTVKPALRSEDVPAESDDVPRPLVGLNINKVVYDKEKTVVVMFHQPGCGHCMKLKPIYAKVGEHFKGNDDVVIANFDVSLNEFDLEGLVIRGVPTVALWKAETNELVTFDGDRTEEALLEFVEDNMEEEPSTKDEL